MILKLRNGRIIIEESGTPELTSGVRISFDYELGTNHYKTRLTVADTVYDGKYIIAPLDLNSSRVFLKVELLDNRDVVMRSYIGSFTYMKLCLIANDDIVNVYEELQRLTKENKELREKGDVI
jgi:hypothetical protein